MSKVRFAEYVTDVKNSCNILSPESLRRMLEEKGGILDDRVVEGFIYGQAVNGATVAETTELVDHWFPLDEDEWPIREDKQEFPEFASVVEEMLPDLAEEVKAERDGKCSGINGIFHSGFILAQYAQDKTVDEAAKAVKDHIMWLEEGWPEFENGKTEEA